jgi:hypothetical protein
MKSSYKTSRNDDDDCDAYCIDNASMIGLKKFYNAEPTIQTCRKQKLDETFHHKWSIGIWYMKEREIRPVTLLNTQQYRNLLMNFMSAVNDYMNLFKFVGYYCRKDMHKWIEKHVLDEKKKNAMDYELELPFGVIDLGFDENSTYGQYWRIRKKSSPNWQIEFECKDEKKKAKYNYYVYDGGATFELMKHKSGFGGGGVYSDILRVNSPFYKLYRTNSLIDEARTCLMDANFQSTHPEAFLVAKSLPDSNIRDVAEDVRYSSDSLSLAVQTHGIKRTEIATKLASGFRNRINQANYRMNEQRADEKAIPIIDATIHNERKESYVRPDMKESMEVLPELTDINRGHVPISLVNPEEMDDRYEKSVCSIMHFPHFFYDPTSTHGSDRAHLNPEQVTFACDQLYRQVILTQAQFQTLFNIVYIRTFGQLDRNIFGTLMQDESKVGVRLNFDTPKPVNEEAVTRWLDLFDRGLITFEEMRRMIAQTARIKLEKNVKRKLEDVKGKEEGGGRGGGRDENEKEIEERKKKRKKNEKIKEG